MQDDNFNKTPHILHLFWPQFFTKIFTGKMILPMVLPVNQWYGKFSKLASLDAGIERRPAILIKKRARASHS